MDFGTSNTVGVLAWPDGRTRPLLFDGAPLLSSAVYADGRGRILVGREANHSARVDPARFEPNPKRRIDELELFLGDQVYPVADLFAAVLGRVADEATRTAGEPMASVTLTCPASWGPARRAVLTDAAATVGLPGVRVVPEPVAAAAYFATVGNRKVPIGSCVVVYDLGGGTFDASVVRRTRDGFDTLAFRGLDDFGGVDLDALVIDQIGTVLSAAAPQQWQRITQPTTGADRRQALQLWEDARSAKETLSRHSSADLHVPIVDRDVHITREEFEAAARLLISRTVDVTAAAIREARIRNEELAGLFLVGGCTRIPLVATLLHQGIGIAPTILEQPEIVVAEGALQTTLALVRPEPVTAPPAAPMPAAAAMGSGSTGAGDVGYDTPVSGVPVSGGPVSGGPVSGVPVSGVPVSRESPSPLPASAPMDHPTGTVFVGRTPDGQSRPSSRRLVWITGVVAVLALLVALGVTVALKSRTPANDGRADPVAVTSSAPSATASAGESVRASVTPSATPTPTRTNAPARSATLLGKVIAPTSVFSVALTANGTILATGADDGSVRIWDVNTRQQQGSPLTGHTGQVAAMAFSGDGTILATASADKTVRLWNVSTHAQIGTALTGHTDSVLAVAFNYDSTKLATGSADTTVRLWNVSTHAQIGSPYSGHSDWVHDVAFNPLGDTLASAGYDKTVRLWSIASNAQIGQPLMGHTDKVYRVAFYRDGVTLASASQDKSVRLWNVSSHQWVATLTGHTQFVGTLSLSNDGLYVGTASFDGTVRLWDFFNHQQISQMISGGVAANSVSTFSEFWRVFAGVGTDGTTVSLWKIV